MTEQADYFIPYPGGIIECSKALIFMGTDQATGQAKEVSLPDRIVVTWGKKKVTLNGAMVKAISKAYKDDATLKAWCETC